jgi:hypothetical protein
MELNFQVFLYLFLRLSPFILACFFTLASIFNQDYKGVIYLAGLILSSVFVIMASYFPIINNIPHTEAPEICRLFTMGQTDDISALPLGQSMLTFTFTYLLYPMIKNNLVKSNIPTMIFFPLLIAFDFWWNAQNSCYNWLQLLVSAALGGVIGWFWAYIVSNGGNNSDNIYFTSLSEKETCSKPSKSTFKCNVYKNGKLISKNIGG